MVAELLSFVGQFVKAFILLHLVKDDWWKMNLSLWYKWSIIVSAHVIRTMEFSLLYWDITWALWGQINGHCLYLIWSLQQFELQFEIKNLIFLLDTLYFLFYKNLNSLFYCIYYFVFIDYNCLNINYWQNLLEI